MKRTEIAALYGSPETFGDTQVTVCGWARSIRDSKALGFIDLNDGSCFKGVQIVFTAEKLENYKEIASQNVGAALRVTGTLLLTPEAKQPFEIQAEEITVEGASSLPEYLTFKRSATRWNTCVRSRTCARERTSSTRRGTFAKVADSGLFAQRNNENGFTYVHTPIVTGSDCEGAGEMFQLTTLDLDNVPKNEDGTVDYSKDFFGKQTSLTVSGQLEAECMAMAFGKVYTFGPTFRAERSYTQRHAAEFWMVEPEIAFADLNDDMDLMEAMIKYIIKDVMARCPQDIDFFNQFVDKGLKERLEHVANSDFVRISYTDAVKLLEKNNDNFEYKVSWGCDLQTEHERYLTEKEFGKPVFVNDYPKEIAAYMRLNDDDKTVAATDLLVPGIGELCGASQREERYDVLLNRIRELGLNEEDYWWYLDLRRFGGNKHAGFGLGFERMVTGTSPWHPGTYS